MKNNFFKQIWNFIKNYHRDYLEVFTDCDCKNSDWDSKHLCDYYKGRKRRKFIGYY